MSTFFVFDQCFTKLFKRDWHIHCRGVDKSEEQDVSSDLLVGMQSRLPVIVIRSKPGWTFKFSMFNVRSGLLIAFTRAPCHLRVRCTSRQLSSAFHCMDLKRESVVRRACPSVFLFMALISPWVTITQTLTGLAPSYCHCSHQYCHSKYLSSGI